jgi:CheY-like chemotaxis protein
MARILIIEDDDLLRDVLAKALEQVGHVVFQATNGQEGITMFRANPTDLVLTDLVMPVQEGVETIQQLRRQNRTLPIIAMSGGVPNSRLYLSIAGGIGAQRVLAKPFTPQRLLEVVNEILPSPTPGVA